MAAPRLRGLLLGLSLAAAAAAPPPLAAAPDEASRALARALFDEARSQSEAGAWAAAASLLAEARALDGSDSDIRYLSALAARAAGLGREAALAELDAALEAGRFSDCDEAEARLLAGELLADLRRWPEALRVLPPAAPGSALEPGRRLVRARAFLGLADEAAYASELAEALRRYPEDPRFPRLLFSRLPPSSAPAALRPLVELALSRVARLGAADPELAAIATPFMPDRAAALDALRAFRAAGGSSPAATLLALEQGLVGEAGAAAELLSGARPPRLEELRRALALARNEAGRDELAAALGRYEGMIESDPDGDGIVEARTAVAGGLVLSYWLDADQDGLAELELSFSDGLPRSGLARSSGADIGFDYAAYPLLSSATLRGPGGASSYELAQGELSYAPLRISSIAGRGRSSILLPEPTGEPAPSPRALVAASLVREAETEEGLERLYLDRGIPERREIVRDGRLRAVREYRLGRPELERADLDGDGRFETERGFAPAGAGAQAGPFGAEPVAWARVDADGDGIFEYREESAFPFRKEWDLDGNGSIDARSFELRDGSLRCEYSSRLDGRFDEVLLLRGGEIVALEKGGRPLDLVPDANPALCWIGRKPFDLGPELPEGEGIFRSRGIRYRLVRAGSRAFAEVLP